MLTPEHIEKVLSPRGISPEGAETFGIRSVSDPGDLPADAPGYWRDWLPGLLIPHSDGNGRVEWQIRPDAPVIDESGRAVKYAFRSRENGYQPFFSVRRPGGPDGVRILAEGTFQAIAAALWAPGDAWILGMPGCRGWMSDGTPVGDLEALAGHDVVVALDADMWSNTDVWDAGEALRRALIADGAKSVRFVRVPAGAKAGLDDVLGKKSPAARSDFLGRLVDAAEDEKFPVSRRPKPPRKAGGFFGEEGLMVETLAKAVFARYPSALSRERKVAIYEHGVYDISQIAFLSAVAELLGEQFRPAHEAAAEAFTVGTLHRTGRVLPEHSSVPVLNCANGMLDLRTEELTDHDPEHLSTVQIPIEWDPDAACPVYERWLYDTVGSQADHLEESAATMLDPSRTPSKAVFLFGPSRSGKSTFLRIMQGIAGMDNVSGVSLAQLCEDRFAAANVYGKMLNCSADLSARHVEDLSLFKMMTGEDIITANRKYGSQFSFTSQALFAFSANELPTVGESSRAYSERMEPFKFGRSFAGHEDPAIEDAMLAELPGILVRWVRAWRRRYERGATLPTDPSVRSEFEIASDRVRQFVSEACEVHATIPPADSAGGPGVPAAVIAGAEVPARYATSRRDLAKSFNRWAQSAGSTVAMGERKVISRLTSINGVMDVRIKGSGGRAMNVTVLPEALWGERAVTESSQGAEHLPAVPAVSTHMNQVGRDKVSPEQDPVFLNIVPDGSKLPELPETRPAALSSPRPVPGSDPFSPATLAASPETAGSAGTAEPAPAPNLDEARPVPTFVPARERPAYEPMDRLITISPVPPPTSDTRCDLCGEILSPVESVSGLYYGCRTCHPDTFKDY